jgi:hypothetical protein
VLHDAVGHLVEVGHPGIVAPTPVYSAPTMMSATILDWTNQHFVALYVGITAVGVAFRLGISAGQQRSRFWDAPLIAYAVAFPFMVVLCVGLALVLLDKVGV